MSRSTKKPYYTDQQANWPGRSSKAKRSANKEVRRQLKVSINNPTADLADGKQYRKVSNSWDIRDWTSHCPKDKKAYRK